MRFPAFSLETLIAKIINIWQVGISVASFILKDLEVFCRLWKTQRSCLCWWNAGFSRSGCNRCLTLEKHVLVLKKVSPSAFGPTQGAEGWQSTCRPKQCSVLPAITRNPSLLSLPAHQGCLCILVPITISWGQAEIRFLTSFHPGDPESPDFHPFLCIFKLSHSPSCLTWYRLYTEPGEHFSFPLLCLFLACFYF